MLLMIVYYVMLRLWMVYKELIFFNFFHSLIWVCDDSTSYSVTMASIYQQDVPSDLFTQETPVQHLDLPQTQDFFYSDLNFPPPNQLANQALSSSSPSLFDQGMDECGIYPSNNVQQEEKQPSTSRNSASNSSSGLLPPQAYCIKNKFEIASQAIDKMIDELESSQTLWMMLIRPPSQHISKKIYIEHESVANRLRSIKRQLVTKTRRRKS